MNIKTRYFFMLFSPQVFKAGAAAAFRFAESSGLIVYAKFVPNDALINMPKIIND